MSIEVEANGDNEHPIFKYLKKSLPQPSDDPESLMANPQFFIWRPVKRSDIAWNFEKFLIGPDGTPLKRYSRYVQILRGLQEGVYLYIFFRNFLTSDIAADISKAIWGRNGGIAGMEDE